MQVERHPGEQVGGADRGEIHPQDADRNALVGATGGVHGQQLRVAAQRLAAQAAAPRLEAAPGRAVDPVGAVAAGAAGIFRGAGGDVLQLGRAGGPAGHDQVAQQVGAQDVAGVLRRCGALGRRPAAAASRAGFGAGEGSCRGQGRVRGRRRRSYSDVTLACWCRRLRPQGWISGRNEWRVGERLK